MYTIVVIFLGVVGLYSAVNGHWSAYDWILYSSANILLALYVLLYQFTSRFTLFLTSIAAILLAISLQWLFIETADMNAGNDQIIIRNFIGAVGAWGLIYALITLGQFFVYTIGFNKKFQSICFFIGGILLLVGIGYWNKSSYCSWMELIGYGAVGTFLILFCALHTHRNSKLDLDSLLDWFLYLKRRIIFVKFTINS